MGLEAVCTALIDGTPDSGRLHLDSSELRFRGAARVVIPFATMRTAEAVDGSLRVEHSSGAASFALGPSAARWAEKIRSPKRLIDKLGVAPDARVAVLGIDDADFREQLAERTE